MNVSDFDFDLPEELIALRPARPRDSARLLVVRPDGLEDRVVRELPAILKAGDMLVMNDSRVIRAALTGTRAARGEGAAVAIDVNLNRRLAVDRWSAFARPGKRLKEGDVIAFTAGLEARVTRKDEALVELTFNRAGAALDAAVEAAGAMPLPPYIASKRAPDAEDASDYQTTFAREDGSVAAPTAGLHFTPELFERLGAAGVGRETVTLHVNAGTFLPVSAERVEDHRMHAERAVLTRAAAARINAVRAGGGRCIPVGTTALRTLESAMAGKPAGHDLDAYEGETAIFITPGFRFRAADALLTNFHLPKSTLFMLVSAMMGLEVMQRAYAHAIEKRFRFFSYGDACLLLPHG